MTEIFLVIIILLLVVAISLLIILLRHRADSDLSPLRHRFDSLEKSHDRIERSLRNDIAKNREEALSNACQAREEISNTLKAFGDSLQAQMTNIAGLQKDQLEIFSERLEKLTESNDQKLHVMRETIEQRLGLLQDDNGKKLDQMREEAKVNARQQRDEVTASLKNFNDSVLKAMSDIAT